MAVYIHSVNHGGKNTKLTQHVRAGEPKLFFSKKLRETEDNRFSRNFRKKNKNGTYKKNRDGTFTFYKHEHKNMWRRMLRKHDFEKVGPCVTTMHHRNFWGDGRHTW